MSSFLTLHRMLLERLEHGGGAEVAARRRLNRLACAGVHEVRTAEAGRVFASPPRRRRRPGSSSF